MRFCLVDRILEVEPGVRIRVVKNLTLGEEYLADHFPTFPVMPGVLMLETLVEAAAWLIRLTEDFAHSVVVLREAKNVKYGNFMEPGRNLVVTAELAEPLAQSPQGLATFKGKGEVDGTATVSARVTLARYNLRDRNPALREADARIVNHLRGLHAVLGGRWTAAGVDTVVRPAKGKVAMRLKDQVALVTGGSRGIGRGIVKAFASEGAKVALVFRGHKEAADSLVAEVADAGGTALALQGDVASSEDAQRCAERVEKEWGRLDILVNNAGIIRDDLFVRMEPEAWKAVLETNLGGTYNFCRAVAYTMMKQRRGRIINISSVAADYVNLGQTNYAASKGAINAFTRALAVELASRNVTVNAIAPGFIETDMSEAVRNKAGDMIKKAIPMRRLGQPDDIARVAVFLAGPESAYMTGQVLTVDGGLSLGAVSG